MTPVRLPLAALRRYVALLGGFAALLPCLQAQSAAPTAAELAKYDLNKNGVIDANELAALEAGRKGDTVLLTPFEVSTSSDRGYAAGNTLSGGRADTPLAITPASISVMTKEFLEDFNITDMNQAMQWTIGANAPTGGESGPFGGNRFQSDFRGAGNGANYPARNGALQYFVADSYNSERFDFSRGPNAALFGDAGPGGIQGSSSKQARFNDRRNSLSLQGNSYGGYRATLDSTYGFDRFSVRLNALRQETTGYQNGAVNTENAFTLSTSFKIAANTVLRAEYERTHEWQLEYRKTYGEQTHLWDGKTVNNDNTVITTPGQYGLQQISNTNDYLVYNFGTNSLLNYKGFQYRSIGLGYQIPWQGRPDLPGFKPGISKRYNLGPADAAFVRDLNNRGVYLEHRLSPSIFLQLAYLSHDIDPVALYSQGIPSEYRLDVNRLLPNGGPNPNFLKEYADWGQNSQYQQNGVREYRFIGTYKFEIPRAFDLKQNFVLNGGWRQDLYEAWNRAWRWTNNPLQGDFTNGVNTLNYRVYWDQPSPRLAPVLPPTVPGMTFANVDTGFAAHNDRRLTYAQVVSQTSFFNERLGIIASIRRDKNQDDTQGNIGFDPVTHLLLMGAQNPKTLVNEVGRHGLLTTYQTSKSGGFVTYPFPASWGSWLAPLGFTANYSQNFSIPSTGANLITGERPQPPVATTKDWGLRYAVPGGVVYATVSHYETTQTGNIQTFGNLTDFRNIWLNLGYTESNLSGADFNYRDTNDRKLEGWEVELTANPNRNITLTANYSHPIVTTISDSPGRRAYYAANSAQFKAGAAAQTGQVLNGHTIQDPTAIAQAIQNIENSFNGFTPGTLANNLERHRINVAGSYSFTDGALKGLRLNAGANYRGHKKVGSRDANIKFQTTSPTVNQTAQAGYDYLWVGETLSTSAGASYTYRFGKQSVRFQLNIDNVLNDDKPQWTSYSTINAGQLQNIQGVPGGSLTIPGGNPRMQVRSGFAQLDPRKFTFTTTVSF
jgi:hypothetical protein